MERFLNFRLFWTHFVGQSDDGYYYHIWTNIITDRYEKIFAGYNKNALTKKRSSWKTLKKRL